MSNYFYERIKNLSTGVSSTNSGIGYRQNASAAWPTAKKLDVPANVTDDELLESVLQFEKTPQFKRAEEEAKQERDSKVNGTTTNSLFKQLNGSSSFSSMRNPPKHSASAVDIISSKDRLTNELHSIVSSSKKRSASGSSDDDVIPIEPSAPSIVRPPIKKLSTSKPDFDSFAPPKQTIDQRTKSLLNHYGQRRARGEHVAMSQIIAAEQLKLREKLMRQPKESTTETKPTESKKPTAAVKRKIDETVPSTTKKARTAPKNAFDKMLLDMTGKMTLVTLTNTTTSNTTTISSSTSHSCIDLTLSESTLPKPSVLPVQSTSVTVKDKKAKPRKIHTYDDYLICILKWPTSLIDELEIEMGLLYKEFLGENTYPVPLLELYSSFEEYEEITIPWLFEETFEEIKRSVKMNDHKLSKIEFDAVLPQIRLLKSGIYELKSQILQKRTATSYQRREMFNEDDLVIVTLLDQPIRKIFGLVQTAERVMDKARLHKSFVDHPDVKIHPPVWMCYEYNIRIFGNGMKIVDGSKIKIQAIASLTATLRRFRALASMRSCPLFEHLLSPSLTDNVFQINKERENCMEEKYFQAYNESQRNVITEAVSMMCSTKDNNQAKIYMCQGPPGTGKSQTITGIVRALLQSTLSTGSPTDQSAAASSTGPTKKKSKILICCPSNGGCNEIVRRLIDVFAPKIGQQPAPKLPFKLIRCARGGAVSEDIENVSLDVLAQKRLEEVLNTGGQNEAIERNLANKEKQKKQLLDRIQDAKRRHHAAATNTNVLEELRDLELNLKEITASILKLQQTCRKTLPESARRQRERDIKLELLQDADICVATLNYVGNSIFDSFCPFGTSPVLTKPDKFNKVPAKPSATPPRLFDCLIIDEAGQCIEIDNYIPLRLGMNRIVLVGDPEQLPATILSRRALDAGLNQSLFERLYRLFKYDLDNPIRMLNVQYRMHDEICKFPSMHIYRSKLKTDRLTNQKRKKFPLRPYMVLDVVNGQEQLDPVSQSYGNPLEADIAACLVQFINEQARVPFNQIGIITPYNYQVKLIEQRLSQYNLHKHKIEMGTVDAFQGRQKDVIILSCVRATQMTDASTAVGIGFVANRQRLNVSLTRAKYAMYILGHMDSLNINEDWKKLCSNAVERKSIVQLTSPDQFVWLNKRQQDEQTRSDENM